MIFIDSEEGKGAPLNQKEETKNLELNFLEPTALKQDKKSYTLEEIMEQDKIQSKIDK